MISWAEKQIQAGWKTWQRFWFDCDAEAHWRVFAKALSALMLIYYLGRLPDLRFAYGEEGMFTYRVLREVIPPSLDEYRYSLLSLSTSPVLLYALYGLLLASLVGVLFGIYPLVCSALAFGLHLSFANRGMFFTYGFDRVAGTFLFYLILAGGGSGGALRSSVALRMMQLQVSVIYAYSGIDKIRGNAWWRGEAMWWLVSNPQQVAWDMTWLAAIPGILAIITVATWFWEVYFPLAVATSARRLWLIGGVLMHLGIATYMRLPFFATLMVVSYIFYLRPEELEALVNRISSTSIMEKYRAFTGRWMPRFFT
jgi:hypothetical protein